MGDKLQFQDGDAIQLKIKEIQDGKADTDWLLLAYPDNNVTLALEGAGSGGIEELAARVNPDAAFYGLLRKKVSFDSQVKATTRFVFIDFIGANVAGKRRGQLAGHKGQIHDLLGPFHATLNADEKEDLTEAAVDKLLGNLLGTRRRSRSRSPKVVAEKDRKGSIARAGQRSGNTNKLNVATKGSKVPWANADEVAEAVKSVRDPKNEIDWLVVTYDDAHKTPSLGATGPGGAEALAQYFKEDVGAFALLKVHSKEDATYSATTTKMVYIIWMGDNLYAMKKARVLGHKDGVKEMMGQVHVEMQVSSLDEVSPEAVLKHVKKFSST